MAAHSIYRVVDAFFFRPERRTSTISSDPNASWMPVAIGGTQVISTKNMMAFRISWIMRVAKCQTNCYFHLSWTPKLFDYFSHVDVDRAWISTNHFTKRADNDRISKHFAWIYTWDTHVYVAKVAGAAEQFNWQMETRRIDGNNISRTISWLRREKKVQYILQKYPFQVATHTYTSARSN